MTMLDRIEGSGFAKVPSEKDKAEYVLLIGEEQLNEESDEMSIVALPQPVGLDTMRPTDVKGEGAIAEDKLKGNELLEALLAYAKETLEPGARVELNLRVWVYRKKAGQAIKHKKASFNFIKQ